MNQKISWKYAFMLVILVFSFAITSTNINVHADDNGSDLLPLNQKDWSLHYVDSEHTDGEDGRATNAFDGKEDTYWHSKHSPADELPHEIQVNLGGVHELEGFSYLPRQIKDVNGTVKEYEFYVSMDGKEWDKAVVSGEFENSIDEKVVTFDEPVIGKYVRFVALSEIKGQDFTSMAELNVFQTQANQDADKTIEVNPTDFSLDIGEREQLEVNWKYGNIEKDITDLAKYTSLNTDIATVSSKGLVTGRGAGETTIRINDGSSKPVEVSVTVEGEQSNEVEIIEDGNLLTIQNWYMARVFDISDRKVRPKQINNRISGTDAIVESGEEFILYLDNNETMKASEFTLESWEDISEKDDEKIIKFKFEEKDDITVAMYVEMKKDDHFIRKHLEIDSKNPDLHISDVDLENLDIPGPHWSSPQSGLQGSGQPVYANDLFFGVEFPGAHNQMKNSKVVSSYALGYPDIGVDKIVTKTSVTGVAPSHEEIRSSFLEYVDTIALPPRFQLQYNPWFELYHDADSESLIKTYKDVEKGMSSYGVRPFDIYAADDGWMDYRKGFWDFNDQTFPNEFQDVKDTLKHFNSKFGVWLGPTGGYKEPGAFAEHLNSTYGYPIVNGRVDGADPQYTEALRDRMMNLTDEYDVNYWKLDGFLFGDFSQDYITRFFDIWLDIYDDLRDHEKDIFINMTTGSNNSPWLLPYVNSIWLNIGTDAGYVGTGSDRDQMLTYVDDKYYDRFQVMESQMPLRFIYNHEPIHGIHVQNPAGRDYTQTDEEWRRYLFMSLLRGTGFIEVYYSPSLFDDAQWTINADALTWAEDNFDALSEVDMFGGSPKDGDVYGYSGWTADKGIVGFRNPSSEKQVYEITLDSLMGVKDKEQTYYRKTVYPYGESEEGPFKYGDTIEITLDAHEAYIWQFEAEEDVTAPNVVDVKGESKDQIKVIFDERVEKETAENIDHYLINNDVTVTHATLGEDYSSVVLDVEALEKGTQYELTVENVMDMANNASDDITTSFVRHDDGLVAHWKLDDNADGDEVADLTGNKNDATIHNEDDDSFYLDGGTSPALTGKGDIALSINLKTSADKEEMIVQQNNEADELQYELKVNKDGYVEWITGTSGNGFKAISEVKVNDGKSHHIVAVREANGLGKIYIDGELVGSDYNETAKRKGIKTDLESGHVIVGKVDEVQIYNRSIPHDEVEELDDNSDVETPFEETISQDGWKVHYVSSEEAEKEQGTGVAKDAFDDNPKSFWHSQYHPDIQKHPHELQIDLGEIHEMKGFRYLPRQEMNGDKYANGIIKDYEFYVSVDGENWGDPVSVGEFAKDNTEKEVLFDEPQIGKYIRIVAKSEIYDQDYAHIAELNVLQTEDNALDKHLQVSETDLAMKVGEEENLAVELLIGDKVAKVITELVTFSSADESIATVDGDGVVTGLKAGTTTITIALEGLDSIDVAVTVEKNDDSHADKSDLAKAVTDAEALDLEGYTKASVEALKNKLAEANDVLADENSTQAEVDQALKDLEAAVEGLEKEDTPVEVDKSALEKAVTDAEAIDVEGYTKASIEALNDKLAEANDVLADENSTQAEVNQALEDLEAAVEGLEKEDTPVEVDKSALEKAITDAEAIDVEGYTKASVEALNNKLAEAKDVAQDEESTQAAVNQALKDLEAAVKGLKKQEDKDKVDKTALEKVVTEAKEINLDKYTDKSASTFLEALKQAESVLADENASQEKVDETFKALEKSIEALEEQESDPGNKGEDQDEEKDTGDKDKDKDKNKGTDQGSGTEIDKDKDDKNDTEDGQSLPKTATSIFNWLLLGILLSGIGIAVYTVNRNKRVSE